jgi:hypothetical protein
VSPVLRIRIRDPGSGAFLTPGSGIRDPGWVKSQDPDPGSGIRDEQPRSYFLELRNHFFGLKYLNSLMRIQDPGSGIRDGNNSDPGSGIRDGKKSDPGSGIRDKHPGSATLCVTVPYCYSRLFSPPPISHRELLFILPVLSYLAVATATWQHAEPER